MWVGTSFQHFYLSTQILGSKNRVYSFVMLDDLKSSFYNVIDEFVSSVQKILADWPPKHAFFNALVGRRLVSFFIALRFLDIQKNPKMMRSCIIVLVFALLEPSIEQRST